jgi:pseudouridine synthase
VTGRLDRVLGACLLLPRKDAQIAVRAGRVSVEGVPCRDPGAKVDNAAQAVTLDGMPVLGDGMFYLLLYKPTDVLSATEDTHGATTALDLLPDRWKKADLGVCGRLDRDAEGLLLLTNDGALNHRLTAPKSHLDKKYLVKLDAPADETDVLAFTVGLELSDFTALPAGLEILPDCAALVTLHEGKFHQIKRMFAARGKTVLALKRISIGPLLLDPSLKPGEWRPLTPDEKTDLQRASDRMLKNSYLL